MKNGIFNHDNIVKVMLTLVTAAIMYLFSMVFDIKHMVIVTNEAQEQNVRQWQKISKSEIEIAVNTNDIKWLKSLYPSRKPD